MRFIAGVMLTAGVVFAATATAAAQSPASWGELTVAAARVDFDLSGTGQANAVIVRATRGLTPNVSLELRGMFARPCQQFQDCQSEGPATLFAPEAQLQYHWGIGRVEPYVGAGLGASALSASGRTDWAPTTSFAAGSAVRLTDHLALTGEFRLRGHEWRFTGTTTEIAAGLAWRLPSF